MSWVASGSFFMVLRRSQPWELALPTIRKGKPTLGRGEIAVELELEVPRALFDEWIPKGKITVPENLSVGRPEVVVELPESGIPSGVTFRLVPMATDFVILEGGEEGEPHE